MKKAGFTLIEVLVAMSLAVMLMAGIWMIVDNHRQLQEKGNKQVIRTQIVRGLQRRFHNDMQSLRQFANRNGVHRVPEFKEVNEETFGASFEIETKPEEQVNATPESGRRAAANGDAAGGDPLAAMPSLPPAYGVYLSGTSTSLTFNLPRESLPPLREVAEGTFDEYGPAPNPNLNANPNGSSLRSDPRAANAQSESLTKSLGLDTLPLAQRVRYEFSDPLNAQAAFFDPFSFGFSPSLLDEPQQDEPQITQLVRTAGFVERMPFLMNALGQSDGSSSRNDPGFGAIRDLDLGDESELPETGEVEDAIPEIIWCRFYYYDGFQWRGEWESTLEKGLPVAVAMHFVVNEPLEPSDPDSLDPLDSLYGDLQSEVQAANSGGASSTMIEPVNSLDELVEADRPDGDYHRIICALSVPDPTAVIQPLTEVMPGGGFLP